jgi:hypothetical protein
MYQQKNPERPKFTFDCTERFHELCDNQGPTLTFVRANYGYIFGGFNPVGWQNSFSYSESSEAYLFSVSDTKGRKPAKCPVKQQKTQFAIKQNGDTYSPAFGEANTSDLFIAFKNPAQSYSNLGNCYSMPKGMEQLDASEFLAGRKDDWLIEEIEVWAVNIN